MVGKIRHVVALGIALKVDGSEWLLFPDKPISRRIWWNMQLVRDNYQIKAAFLIIFRVHMRVLCIIKVKILVLIQ